MSTTVDGNVPVIDFSAFLSGDASAKEAVAAEIFHAFRDIGFVTLTHHGISEELLKRTFSASESVFDLENEIKAKYAWTTPEANRGYLGMGMEKLADGQADIKETFEIGNDQETTFPNHWPSELPTFKSTMLEYFNAADTLHLNIMSALACGMGLNPDFFTPLCDENHQNLRLLHYPSCKRDEIDQEEKGQKRAGAHTDYGSVTLLAQSDVGGLQARRRDGEWINVEPTPNAMIVNVGDCLMRWSNDVLISTPHRVIQDPRVTTEVMPRRFSIAFFCNPNKDTVVECLPGCSSSENPPKYAPIKAFDHLVGRLNDTI
jgi:isopenicillin N synthase-like dioxygenase